MKPEGVVEMVATYFIVGKDGSKRAIAERFLVAVRAALDTPGALLKSGDTGHVWTREVLKMIQTSSIKSV